MKIGDRRYCASIDDETGKIEFAEYVLRTIRKQRPFKGASWIVQYGYWVQHVHGVTWIKLSSKQGDWGYAKNVDRLWVTRKMTKDGAPYAASKRGALANLLASKRSYLKRFGEFEDDDDDNVEWLSISEQIKRIEAAQKRLKTKLAKAA